MKKKPVTIEQTEEFDKKNKDISVLVNIVFGLVNMSVFTVKLVDTYLHKYKMEYNQQDKMLFSEIQRAADRMRYLNKRLSRPLYEDSGAMKCIQEDSNQMMRFFLLLLDRTGGDPMDLLMQEAHLHSLPSRGIIREEILNLFKMQK